MCLGVSLDVCLASWVCRAVSVQKGGCQDPGVAASVSAGTRRLAIGRMQGQQVVVLYFTVPRGMGVLQVRKSGQCRLTDGLEKGFYPSSRAPRVRRVRSSPVHAVVLRCSAVS